jgi:hypothetical protein
MNEGGKKRSEEDRGILVQNFVETHRRGKQWYISDKE